MQTNVLNPTQQLEEADTPTFAVEPVHFNLEHTITLKEYGRLRMRPIRPDDEPKMIEFHRALSDESVHFRYFGQMSLEARTRHERLAQICRNTVDCHAFVVEQDATASHPARILAVGRLTTTPTPCTASFAVLVADSAQWTDLPCELLKRVMTVARAYRFHTLVGEFLVDDHEMINLCRSFGFRLVMIPDDGIVSVTCAL